VVGDEPCIILDFAGMEHYAERFAQAARRPDLPADQLGAYE
jgi:hypothetical protein